MQACASRTARETPKRTHAVRGSFTRRTPLNDISTASLHSVLYNTLELVDLTRSVPHVAQGSLELSLILHARLGAGNRLDLRGKRRGQPRATETAVKATHLRRRSACDAGNRSNNARRRVSSRRYICGTAQHARKQRGAQTNSLILSPNAGAGRACASTFWSM